MSFETLHPGFEAAAGATGQAARLTTLAGARIGLLDNNKKSVTTFLSAVEDLLKTQFAVASVTRVTKSNASTPCPDDLVHSLNDVDAVITGIGD